MTGELPTISLKPIGIVRNKVKQPLKPPYDLDKVVSEIEIAQNLTEALDNLDEFSHITVIYWMHQINTTETPPTKVHPKGKLEQPLVGLFATRSPNRPNPLGETAVKLINREGNVLTVRGLDAIDGTPVIDIKPYLPRHDSIARAKVPWWVSKR